MGSKQVVIALFADETAADAAVESLKHGTSPTRS